MNVFRQLRWKLTLSYTLVTVCAFLVITLILGGLLFSKVMLPYNVLTSEGLVQDIMNNLNPMWSHILSQSPVDMKLISYQIHDPVANFSQVSLFQVGSVKFTVNTIADVKIFVIDADGILLGASDISFPPTSPIGKPFPVEKIPGLQTIYEAALAGETDPKSLYSLQGKVNSRYGMVDRFNVAIPIFEQENGTQGKVLGVIAAVLDPFPYQSEIPRHLLVLAARSLLFFLFSAGVMGAVFGSFSAHGLTMRLRKLSTATDRWSEGDFSSKVSDNIGDEISTLAGRMNTMAGQLQSLLQRRQEMAVSEERNRLARDLHDSAKQQALAASFELGTALALCDRDPASARKHLVEADALVDSVRIELTNLVHELRPLSSDEQDFMVYFREYLWEWSNRNGIELNLDLDVETLIPLQTREALYRITQEALANVNRHSSASRVIVKLEQTQDGIELVITDNGCGFDTSTQHSGLGLKSMKERAEGLAGSFGVLSAPGQGTRISVVLPK